MLSVNLGYAPWAVNLCNIAGLVERSDNAKLKMLLMEIVGADQTLFRQIVDLFCEIPHSGLDITATGEVNNLEGFVDSLVVTALQGDIAYRLEDLIRALAWFRSQSFHEDDDIRLATEFWLVSKRKDLLPLLLGES